jgi:hypothetical protein
MELSEQVERSERFRQPNCGTKRNILQKKWNKRNFRNKRNDLLIIGTSGTFGTNGTNGTYGTHGTWNGTERFEKIRNEWAE